jgi:hypothetical protein
VPASFARCSTRPRRATKSFFAQREPNATPPEGASRRGCGLGKDSERAHRAGDTAAGWLAEANHPSHARTTHGRRVLTTPMRLVLRRHRATPAECCLVTGPVRIAERSA